jgi:cobalt/nickel transport system permease protein
MSSVLIAQCLIFQDGGLLALGANILNMGLIGCFSSYYIYRLFTGLLGNSNKGRLIGGFTGAWFAIFLASIACAIELAVSGASPFGLVLPAMAGVHALIGIVEGLITVAVLSAVAATRADLLELKPI